MPVDLHIRTSMSVKIDPALLDRYAGTYKYADSDFVVVTREGHHCLPKARTAGTSSNSSQKAAGFLLQDRRRTDHLRDRTGRQGHCRHLASGRAGPAGVRIP
jgi:hypothetical protein